AGFARRGLERRLPANSDGAERMTDSRMDVAASFVRQWESTWNAQGPAATAALYTPDAMLVGAAIAVGRTEIEQFLRVLYDQGWKTIAIRLVLSRAVAGVVLAVSEFSATGTGINAGKTLNGRSSHVLTETGGSWLCAMHSAA